MAQIRVLQAIAGLNFSWTPGQLVDLPGNEAAQYCDGVRAELVRGDRPETPEARSAAVETTSEAPTAPKHRKGNS